MSPTAGVNSTAPTRPAIHAISAISSRTTPRMNATSVDIPMMKMTTQSNVVIGMHCNGCRALRTHPLLAPIGFARSRSEFPWPCSSVAPQKRRAITLMGGGNNAAVALGLQFIAGRDGGFTGRIGAHPHTPERALAGLQRLRICGVSRLLQAPRERIGAFVIRERGELHRE